MNYEKKLKTIKLNLKLIQNKSQKKKNMSTSRPSNQSVSIHIEKSQHKIQQTSTQLGVPIYTGRRIVDNASTHKGRTYHRSTPIARNNWVSQHMNSNLSTHNNEKIWVR